MFAVLGLALFNLSVAAAQPDLNAAVALYNRGAVDPLPTLSAKQHRALQSGEVVAIYRSPDKAHHGGSIGLVISDRPRQDLWLALRDPTSDPMGAIHEKRIRNGSAIEDPELLYQYLSLPWPFGARHWLLQVQNNLTLAANTQDRVWERHWSLAKNGHQRADLMLQKGQVPGLGSVDPETAIYTPVNRGAWFVIDLQNGQNLLGFQVSTVAGGAIPDRLVAQYALMRMDEILRELEQRSRTVHKNYQRASSCIVGANGLPIPGCRACAAAHKTPQALTLQDNAQIH